MTGRTVDQLAATLRQAILDGHHETGARLIERELVARHGVARHTLRAALRQLAAEGLVTLVPNAGAHVAVADRERLRGLLELRTALEVEAARLALERHPDALAAGLADAAAGLRAACEGSAPPWSDVVAGHAAVHRAIVAAADSPRIAAAHAALEAEMHVFLLALRPVFSLPRMAEHHDQLARELPAEGPDALRRHLGEGADAVLAHDEP